jgi:Leucine-rich repeat (LRR) protein
MAAFDNPIIFGFAVKNNLSDVLDKDQALLNLKLQPADLSILGGINAYATNDSFQALSNTDEAYDLTLTRLTNDSSYYQGILSEGSDINRIQGNFTINGVFAAAAIRYFTLDLYDSVTDRFQPLDISTSRVSSWSESVPGKISYGGELKITKNSVVSAGSIKFGTVAEPIVFTGSEIATHVIKISSNNKEYSVYAMKDIPLTINGNFATGTISCNVNPGTNVSFKVFRPDYLLEPPVISRAPTTAVTTRSVTISRPEARARTIEIYTSPAAIRSLTLSRLGIASLPRTKLQYLNTLFIDSNNFSKLPVLSGSMPELTNLFINSNPLRSQSAVFTESLALQLPNTLTKLHIGNTYTSIGNFTDVDTIEKSVFEMFPLTELNIAGGPNRLTGTCPTVSASCITYIASNNLFTTLPERGLLRPQADNKLVTIDLSNNSGLALTSSTSAIFLNNANFNTGLQRLSLNVTNLPIPDMRSVTGLTNFSIGYNRATSYSGNLLPLKEEFNLHKTSGEYKFNNCNNLTNLSLTYGDVFGDLPIFTNNKLSNLILQSTSLSGVRKPGGVETDCSLYKETFNSCSSTLGSLTFTTNNQSFPQLPIELGSLDLPNLTQLTWQTMGYGTTFIRNTAGGTTGTTPSFTGNTKLTRLNLNGNRFDNIDPLNTGLSNSLQFIDIAVNSLTKTSSVDGLNIGNIFSIPFTKLREVYLQRNSFKDVTNVTNIPNVVTLDISFNSLTGTIPDFSNTPLLNKLDLRNNKFSRFTTGAFNNLTVVKFIYLGYNVDDDDKTLSLTEVESIIDSIYIMYTNSLKTKPNANVVIDLSTGLSNYVLETETAIAQARFLATNPKYTFSGVTIPALPSS